MSDDFSPHQRSWIGLIIVLGVAVILCLCVIAFLASGQQDIFKRTNSNPLPAGTIAPAVAVDAGAEPPLEESSATEQPPVGATTWSVRLPDAYTALIRYPVVFEYATAEPQLPSVQPGQAILVTFRPNLSNPLNAWCAETDALKHLQELPGQYSVDPERIYLVTTGLPGLAFATRHASHFCGLLLQLTEDLVPSSWDTLPLGNLNNLPVVLDTSRNPHPDPAVQDLERALATATGCRPHVPLHPLAPNAPLLPQLLSQLTLDAPSRHDHLSWQTDLLATGEAWWLRVEEIATPGQPASFDAEYLHGNAVAVAQITITTQNLNAFAIRRTWKDFAKVRTFILTVDGQRVNLLIRPNTPEWCVIWKHDNGWQPTTPPHDRPRKTIACEGPLVRVLQEPHVIVWGSADPDTAPLWKKSANNLASRWQELTQQSAETLSDQEFISQGVTGMHLILLGSPRENLVTNGLLDTHPDFLRQIYQQDSLSANVFTPDVEEETSLCCLTLFPADFYTPGKLALVVLADSPEFIEKSWQPLFSPQALQCEFLLFHPDETVPRASGWCNSVWEVDD